ncbi:MAG: hypothetical protein MK165_19495 [Pirellulaceae bacterium]|nr:hypothetical protein [Pirellulaceae bacterium]
MKRHSFFCTLVMTCLGLIVLGATITSGVQQGPLEQRLGKRASKTRKSRTKVSQKAPRQLPVAAPISPFAQKGIDWLVEAQHRSGGWGAGSHANQQNLDPSRVQLDPATTAFSGLTLLRAGQTATKGKYRDSLRKAANYLVETVERYHKPGPRITDITGTQPQAKLGQLVDTTLTTQFLARFLPLLPLQDPLHERTDAALDKCLHKLQIAQQPNGSWGAGGWAPVLQSSLGCTALELAQAAGKEIDSKKLGLARKYQQGNFDNKTGKANAAAGAGVELYAFSGAQRASAGQARAAEELVRDAKRRGDLAEDAPVNKQNLQKIGVNSDLAKNLAAANTAAQAQARRLNDETLLRGFGNNGGEEFLSYLMTSESLIITGGDAWEEWNSKMNSRLAKIQNPDGSWNGHHCISSPVFCTAAVLQCITTDRDAEILIQVADNAAQGGMAKNALKISSKR